MKGQVARSGLRDLATCFFADTDRGESRIGDQAITMRLPPARFARRSATSAPRTSARIRPRPSVTPADRVIRSSLVAVPFTVKAQTARRIVSPLAAAASHEPVKSVHLRQDHADHAPRASDPLQLAIEHLQNRPPVPEPGRPVDHRLALHLVPLGTQARLDLPQPVHGQLVLDDMSQVPQHGPIHLIQVAGTMIHEAQGADLVPVRRAQGAAGVETDVRLRAAMRVIRSKRSSAGVSRTFSPINAAMRACASGGSGVIGISAILS